MALDAFAPSFSDFQWPWYMAQIDDYTSLVGRSGLRNVRVWAENADWLSRNVEAMIRWVDQPCLVPFMACVSDERSPSFRDFVVKRMIEETRQEDGSCFETFRRINVSAQKSGLPDKGTLSERRTAVCSMPKARDMSVWSQASGVCR